MPDGDWMDLVMTGLATGAMGMILWSFVRARLGSRGAEASYDGLLGYFATPEARRLVVSAAYAAIAQRARRLEASHVLLALATRPEVALELDRCGVTVAEIARLAEASPRYDEREEAPQTDEEWGQTDYRAITPLLIHAWDKAKATGQRFIDPRSLLGAIIEDDGEEGRLLREAGVLEAASRSEPAAGRSLVYLWNDPKTEMPHVESVLAEHFGLESVAARAVMMAVHGCGDAALGPYAHEEAEARIEAATEATLRDGGSLRVTLERPDTSGWVETARRGLLPPEVAAAWEEEVA